GPVRLPDGRRVLGEDVLEVAAALDALGRERRDVDIACPLVAMLDQQPTAIAAATGIAAAGAYEHPRSLELVPVQRELEVALLERRLHIVLFGHPRPFVPKHDDAGAVAFGNHAFELTVVEGMILDLHGEPLGFRIE